MGNGLDGGSTKDSAKERIGYSYTHGDRSESLDNEELLDAAVFVGSYVGDDGRDHGWYEGDRGTHTGDCGVYVGEFGVYAGDSGMYVGDRDM